MPTSNRRLPKAAAPAYAAPAPSFRPAKRPLSRFSLAATDTLGQDLDTRRALVSRYGDTNIRTLGAAELHRTIMELQAAGASLTRVGAHLGRKLLADFSAEAERRQALAAQKPAVAVTVRAGGYSAAVLGAFGAEGYARLVLAR